MLRDILTYTISFFTMSFLFIYILDIPTLFTGESSLVKEYYKDNFEKNIILDYFLIIAYLGLAYLVNKLLKTKTFLEKLIIVAITTACITGIFYMYYMSQKRDESSFFSRWFHSVTWKAMIYDITIVSSIYFGYHFLNKKLE